MSARPRNANEAWETIGAIRSDVQWLKWGFVALVALQIGMRVVPISGFVVGPFWGLP